MTMWVMDGEGEGEDEDMVEGPGLAYLPFLASPG